MIKIISHRGNVSGENPDRENTQTYIDEAIGLGCLVEVDVRSVDGKLWLGHDSADRTVDVDWLWKRIGKLIVHAKNAEALSELVDMSMMTFYHANESHVAIANSRDFIWTHDIQKPTSRSIIPLLSRDDIDAFAPLGKYKLAGICTDDVSYLKEKLA